MKFVWYIRFLIPAATAMAGGAEHDAEAIAGSTPEPQASAFKCDTRRKFCLDEVVWAKGTWLCISIPRKLSLLSGHGCKYKLFGPAGFLPNGSNGRSD